MSVEYSDYPSPREAVERLNIESAEAVQNLLYVKTVDAIYDGIELHLAADKDAQNSDADIPGFVGAFVQHDVITAPMHGDEAVSTFCTRLEPKVADEEGIKYMELHIPSGDAEISKFEMPPQKNVKEAYIKVGYAKRNDWYAFSKDFGLYPYTPGQETDSGKDEYIFDDRTIMQGISERISGQADTAMQLLRRIISWETVPQDAHGEIVNEVPDVDHSQLDE